MARTGTIPYRVAPDSSTDLSPQILVSWQSQGGEPHWEGGKKTNGLNEAQVKEHLVRPEPRSELKFSCSKFVYKNKILSGEAAQGHLRCNWLPREGLILAIGLSGCRISFLTLAKLLNGGL